ncbi:MAG: Glucose-6-phosphate isomerase [candidate division BRC1 bacterium ADurb.BinA292]|nr:MAG: Glucose-6-phosphate isomerase [candidate division BRC1 bacterium ADurb.BinA292]
MSPLQRWQRYLDTVWHDEELGITLDISRMAFDDGFLGRMADPIDRALDGMRELEAGAIANPDEKRMVGHYWLRAPERAPNDELRRAIRAAIDQVQSFAGDIHGANLRGQRDEPFSDFLLIGIGGSALGPQLVADALGTSGDLLRPHFMDNTDPDGIHRVLGELQGRLDRTLVLVISKSGGTPETRNGMVETQAAYAAAGFDFARHAVAVTSTGSRLHQQAAREKWLAIFPMWDWVGGRTSVTSAVGLLPAALQGVDIDEFLTGARLMDERTRVVDPRNNPAALLALMWHWAGNGRGQRDMVVLPYKDRLMLFSRYLQQLVMESLGKECDLHGNTVHQGLAVYGNKGSTDQHAYVQQLRDGLNNFFVTLIEVLREDAGSESGEPVEVEPGVTSGDFLQGFLLGTREALHEKGRESITITIRSLDARSLGMLIALYERAVGLYASLVMINAYHQPGVEAGKRAAAAILDLQRKLLAAMGEHADYRTAAGWADALGEPERVETIHRLLERLAANPSRRVDRVAGPGPAENTYRLRG